MQSFLVSLANTHDLTHSPHLGAQLVLNVFKFFKGPSGELDHHIVGGGDVSVQGTIPPVGDIIQVQPPGQFGGDKGYGKAGGLGSQGGGSGSTRIYLNDHHPAGFGIVGELNVRAPDDFNGFDNGIGKLLQPLLQVLVNSQHGGGAKGIAGVYAHGVDVFNKADRDHFVLAVTHHFQLQFFPAQHRLLDQDLVDHAGA